MANDVKLPRLGQGMESGTIVRWLKSEGDRVEKGEPLYELDTDKVTQEVESDFAGVLLRIAVEEGEAEVGRTIAVIGEEGEEVAAASEDPGDEGAPQSAEKPAEAPAREPERERGRAASAAPDDLKTEVKAPQPAASDGRVKASPLARRIARERGLDLAAVRGTGPEGRIVAEDVERALAAPAPAPTAAAAAPAGVPPGEVETVPLTSTRRTIARRLTEAWTVPVFQLVVSADMTEANALIARRRELEPDIRVTVTDLLTKVCASALVRHPDVNVQFTGDALVRFPYADVGLAVSAPAGLVVPVIRQAERLGLAEVAAARAELVERARGGKLKREDLEGGTFTISNLGMFGVEQFTAVLNPPQAAILATGSTEERIVARDGAPVARPLMTMSLTCDHRAVDGAPAAEFLRTVKGLLEQPALML
jgi:pyruvate dehydrogenase E2 component (dihydrolipoamide acetyltransferase)